MADQIENYWNESVERLVNNFLELKRQINDENTPFLKTKDGETVVTINEIKKADAGKSFSNNEEGEDDWVIPSLNINNKQYKKVRDEDKTISVLNDVMNLQFTHTQKQMLNDNNWIRLLMPKYTRRVEIEDLNRNFWVISQVAAAACFWLLDDESLLPNVIKDLINEILQLWENIIYLWASFIIQTQKYNDDIHIEMLPLPSSTTQNFNKYDFYGGQFNGNSERIEDYFYTELIKKRQNPNNNIFLGYENKKEEISADIINKINYLTQKYKNQNLCIIPYYRIDNYYANYYSAIVIPAIFTYHQGTKNWEKIWLYNSLGSGPAAITIDKGYENKDYSDYIYAIKENPLLISYNYFTPFSSTSNRTDKEQSYYYGAIRVIPHLYLKLTPTNILLDDSKNNSLELIDAAEGSLISMTGSGEPFLDEDSRLRKISFIDNKYILQELPNHDVLNKSQKILEFKEDKEKQTNRAFYLGELISYRKKTKVPDIQNAEFKLIKIGDFYPANLVEGENKQAKVNRSNFTLIGALNEDTDSYGTEKVYDMDTYGIGAYHLKVNKTQMQAQTGKVVYFNYNYFYSDKMKEGDDSKYYKPIFYAEELTPELLSQLSIRYIKHLRNDNEPTYENPINEPSISGKKILGADQGKTAIYCTKIGCAYWTGTAGPQWNSGIITDIVYASEETDTSFPIVIDSPFLFDGYWTRNNQVFSITQGGRWRRLYIGCEAASIEKTDSGINIDMSGGQLVWYDHNREIYPERYSDGNNQNPNNRPHCSIDFTNKIAFGTGWAPETYANLIKDTNGNINLSPQVKIEDRTQSFINTSINYNLGKLTSENQNEIYKNGFINATFKTNDNGITMGGAGDINNLTF